MTPAWSFDYEIRDAELQRSGSGIWVTGTDPEESWTVRALVVPHAGELRVEEVRIQPRDSSERGVTRRALREVPLGEVLDFAHEISDRGGDVGHALRSPIPAEGIEVVPGSGSGVEIVIGGGPPTYRYQDEAKKRPGRRGRPDSYFAHIAALYVDLIRVGEQRPIQRLANQLQLDASYVRDALHIAREKGLLTKGQRGRASGSLTEKGRHALSEDSTQGEAG